MNGESFAKGVVYTLLSATGLALVGLFGKLGMADFGLSALLFWRYVAAFLICIAVLWMLGKLHNVWSFGNPKIHFLRAFFVMGAQYCYYFYIQRESLMNGLTLLSLGPLSIPFIEWIVTRQRIGKSTWVGLMVSFVGMLLVVQPDGGIFSFLSLVGIFSGLFMGCSQVVFGLSRKSERADISTLYLFFLCVVLNFIPYLFFQSVGQNHVASGYYPILLILLLGGASVLSQLMRAAAYSHGTPARLSTFLYFSILMGGLFDWLVFNRPPNRLSIVGAGLVVLGGVLKIYLRNVILKKQK